LLELKCSGVVLCNNKQQLEFLRHGYGIVKHFYQHGEIVYEVGFQLLLVFYRVEVELKVNLVFVAKKDVLRTLKLYFYNVRADLASLKL